MCGYIHLAMGVGVVLVFAMVYCYGVVTGRAVPHISETHILTYATGSFVTTLSILAPLQWRISLHCPVTTL